MNDCFARRRTGKFWKAVVLSLIFHALVVVVGVWMAHRIEEDEEPPEPETLEITAILEDETEIEPVPPIEVSEPAPVPVEESLSVHEPEPEPEQEQDEEVVEEIETEVGQVVDQATNEEMPEEAEFLSDEANLVEEETVAEETTLDEVIEVAEEDAPDEEEHPEEEVVEEFAEDEDEGHPAEDPEIVVADSAPPPVDEMFAAEDAPEDDSLLAEQAAPSMQQAQRDPSAFFKPQAHEYAEVFDGADEMLRDTMDDDPGGRKFLQQWKDNDDALRASLENFIHHVKPGNHTGVNAHPSAYASYLARIHRRIHQRWAYGFIDHATNNLPGTHPLNNLTLNTLMELVIDASSGEVEQTNIVRSSGETTFDAEAIITVRSVGRHPDPPQQIVSADGKVYLHWNFWRDSRQCGPFGAKIYLLNN